MGLKILSTIDLKNISAGGYCQYYNMNGKCWAVKNDLTGEWKLGFRDKGSAILYDNQINGNSSECDKREFARYFAMLASNGVSLSKK